MAVVQNNDPYFLGEVEISSFKVQETDENSKK